MTGDSDGVISTWDVSSMRSIDSFFNEEGHKPISCINVSNMSDRTPPISLVRVDAVVLCLWSKIWL